MSELTDEQREALAAYFRRRMNGVWSNEWEEQHRRKGLDPMRCNDSICLRAVEEADALSPVLAQMKREWQAEAVPSRHVVIHENALARVVGILAVLVGTGDLSQLDYDSVTAEIDKARDEAQRRGVDLDRAEASGQEPT